MTLSTSAVAACCAQRLVQLTGFCCELGLRASPTDASLRLGARFVFVAAERVRPPRLRPFAFDSPRLICRRPMDSVGRGRESTTP